MTKLREPVTHDLKCWPPHFQSVKSGAKGFELRLNDRDFRVGDTLRLREYCPVANAYSGDEVSRVVSYVLGGDFGLPADTCIMSFAPHLQERVSELQEGIAAAMVVLSEDLEAGEPVMFARGVTMWEHLALLRDPTGELPPPKGMFPAVAAQGQAYAALPRDPATGRPVIA